MNIYHLWTSDSFSCLHITFLLHALRTFITMDYLCHLTNRSIPLGLHKLLTCWKCGLHCWYHSTLHTALMWWGTRRPVPWELPQLRQHQPHNWVSSFAFCRWGTWVAKRWQVSRNTCSHTAGPPHRSVVLETCMFAWPLEDMPSLSFFSVYSFSFVSITFFPLGLFRMFLVLGFKISA